MIRYVVGDATRPHGKGKKIICHICNDVGAWGAGFVLAISKRWDAPEKAYRYLTEVERVLGKVQLTRVSDDIYVANMIAQRDIHPDDEGNPPIRYGAVRICLNIVNDWAYQMGATLHMPRIGCGLAGGDWNKIEQIINDVASVDVTVYDLK